MVYSTILFDINVMLITLAPVCHSFILYAIHDVSRLWQSDSNQTPQLKPFNAVTSVDGGEMGKSLLHLIEYGRKLSIDAHKKLSDHEESLKANKYRKMLVVELDYLEMLLKRAEFFLHCLNNPFMKRLINFTKENLELLVTYFEIILQLYDQGDDQSMPVLTRLLQQLIEKTDLDVGYLNSNGYRDYANQISDYSGRLQTMLREAKQKIDQMDTEEFSERIKKILLAMIDLENLVLDAEKHSNINSIYH